MIQNYELQFISSNDYQMMMDKLEQFQRENYEKLKPPDEEIVPDPFYSEAYARKCSIITIYNINIYSW